MPIDVLRRPMPAALLPLLALGSAAYAVSLPVNGVYGSGSGCALYSEHGIAAIIAAGGTLNVAAEGEEPAESIILTANEVVGTDWTCQPSTVDGENAALHCVTEGATWMPMPIATVQTRGDSLLFTMDDEPAVTLARCGP